MEEKDRLEELLEFTDKLSKISDNPLEVLLNVFDIMNLEFFHFNNSNHDMGIALKKSTLIHENTSTLIQLINENINKFDIKEVPMSIILVNVLGNLLHIVKSELEKKSKTDIYDILSQLDLSDERLEELKKFYNK